MSWSDVLNWMRGNLLDLMQTGAIVVSLIISISEFRKSTRASKLNAVFEIGTSHRELWLESIKDPDLSRVLESKLDLVKQPPTPKELMFVNLIISHANSVYDAVRYGLLRVPKNSYSDFGGFFKLPIPSLVWNQIRDVQDPNFTRFIEMAIKQAQAEQKSPYTKLMDFVIMAYGGISRVVSKLGKNLLGKIHAIRRSSKHSLKKGSRNRTKAV